MKQLKISLTIKTLDYYSKNICKDPNLIIDNLNLELKINEKIGLFGKMVQENH